MEVMLLEDELSASQSCGQRFKVCSIHIKRPVLATMHVQTSSLLGTGPFGQEWDHVSKLRIC